MKKRTLPIIVLLLFAAWHTQAIPAQAEKKIPTEVYKCKEDGKAVYQDGLCTSGPSKPLKTQDAKGIEALKGRAPEEPSGPAVAVIPHTPSKPLSNSTLPRTTSPCRNAAGNSSYNC